MDNPSQTGQPPLYTTRKPASEPTFASMSTTTDTATGPMTATAAAAAAVATTSAPTSSQTTQPPPSSQNPALHTSPSAGDIPPPSQNQQPEPAPAPANQHQIHHQNQIQQQGAHPYPHQINGLGGPTATAPFLRDFSLVAEAAKRAQVSVVTRDLEGVSL